VEHAEVGWAVVNEGGMAVASEVKHLEGFFYFPENFPSAVNSDDR